MSEVVAGALITGGLGVVGVLLSRFRERVEAGETERLRAELRGARAEAERYKAAYLGLLEVTQELLDVG